MNKITITLTDEDYINSQWLHYNVKPTKFLGITLFVMFFSYFMYDSLKIPLHAIFGGIVGLCIWYAFYYLIYIKYKSKKIYKQQKSLQIPTDITWDANKIYMSDKNGSNEILWNDYIKYKENKKLFLLYHSDILFNIVPKSAFLSAEQMNNFKTNALSIKS